MSPLPCQLSLEESYEKLDEVLPTLVSLKMYEILDDDNKDEFVRLAHHIFEVYDSKRGELIIMEMVSSSPAVKCAKAMLDGETPQKFDFHVNMEYHGLPALHLAAHSLCNSTIELFLEHNASTSQRCVGEHPIYNRMLPINVALENVRTHRFMTPWTRQVSVFQLLIRLSNPDLRHVLETVRLLAWKTEELEEEIYHYSKHGRLVELAALLITAHQRVLSPSFFQKMWGSVSPPPPEGMTLRQFATSEITLLTAMELKLENHKNINGESLRMCKNNKADMTSLLLLLEVFERAGDKIAKYLQLEHPGYMAERAAQDVSWILKEAGFTVEAQDVDTSFLDSLPGISDYYKKMYIGELELEKDAVEDSKQCESKELNAVMDIPYEQWRFSSTKQLHGSTSLPVQLSKALCCPKETSGIVLGSCKSKPDGSQKLNRAIKKLCKHPYFSDWSPEKSIFKLLYILCFHELRRRIAHIQSLACETQEVIALGCHYAKEGKIIDLAILLTVAYEKLIPPMGSQVTDGRSSDESAVRCSILNELQNSIDNEIRLVGTSEDMMKCKRRKDVMLSALLLVEVFERAGDFIKTYHHCCAYLAMKEISKESDCYRKRKIAQHVSWKLQQCGCVLKRQDTLLADLNCFMDKPSQQELENLRTYLGGEHTSIRLEGHKYLVMENALVNGLQNGRGMVSRSLSTWASARCSSHVRSLHTFQVPRANSSFMCPTSLENQVKKASVKYVPQWSNSSSWKKWSFFAWAIKMGMKFA